MIGFECDSCHKKKPVVYEGDFINEKLGRQALRPSAGICVDCGNHWFPNEDWKP